MALSHHPGVYPDSALLNLILGWARRYSPIEQVSEAIALRTIRVVSSDPDLVEERDLKLSLFKVLHRVALEDLKITSLCYGIKDAPDQAA